MNINTLATKLGNIANVTKISETEYEIVTGAKINPRTPITLYLAENNGNIYLSDKKNTLKYMSQIYELKSIDVKNCITAVIKIYGFNISSGELIATIKSDASIIEQYYSMIICIGQLANMYAFFDKP